VSEDPVAAPALPTSGDIRLGSEELELVLYVLGGAAALPGRMAPAPHVEDLTPIRRTAAHSLRARQLVFHTADGYRVDPTLAAALAIPTQQVLAYEFDLERDGQVVSGAAGTDGERGLLVRPGSDGTVTVRWFPARELAVALVAAVGSAPGGRTELVTDVAALAPPLPVSNRGELVRELGRRGMEAALAEELATILAGRTGSGQVHAVRPASEGWLVSAVPVSWWDTAAGRYLVTPAPPDGDPDGAQRVRLTPSGDATLVQALAELASSIQVGGS
jgi:EspG family